MTTDRRKLVTPSKEQVKEFCLIFAFLLAALTIMLALLVVTVLYPWVGAPLLLVFVVAYVAWSIVK